MRDAARRNDSEGVFMRTPDFYLGCDLLNENSGRRVEVVLIRIDALKCSLNIVTQLGLSAPDQEIAGSKTGSLQGF
jgi:hypothetical protein